MVTEIAIFRAISASWAFTKDIYTFVSRVKRAGEDIQGLDAKFMNSVLLLGRYFRFFEKHGGCFAPEESSHLQVMIGQIKESAQRQAKCIRRLQRNGSKEKAMWAILGPDLSNAEKELAAWINGLQAWLQFLPDAIKLDLIETRFATERTNARMQELYLIEDDYEQVSPPQEAESAAGGRYASNPSDFGPATNFTSVDLKNLRTEIINSMDSSGQWYSISRETLMAILLKHGVRNIVLSCESLQSFSGRRYEIFDIDAFISDIENCATVALAILLVVCHQLVELKRMLENDFSDNQLPLKSFPVEEAQSRRELWRCFAAWQYCFLPPSARRTETLYMYPRSDPCKLGPYFPEGILESEPSISFDENRDLLASGTFSDVYRASFRWQDEWDTREYAMKRFRPVNSFDVQDHVYNELAMLKELGRDQHPHLLNYVRAWYDGSHCQILFPLAECDLRKVLQQNELLELNSNTVLWLLAQFRGLADALNTLQNRSTASSSRLTECRSRIGLFGYHCDLKPENILVFQDGKSKLSNRTQWRISDFGSSGFGREATRDIPQPSGRGGLPYQVTRAYQGPETLNGDRRHNDMWSLGCMMLEIMAWALRPVHYCPERFINRRIVDEDGFSINRVDDGLARFWQVGAQRKAELKPSVVDLFAELRMQDTCRRGLRAVLDCTQALLRCDSKLPLDSRTLSCHMHTIYARESEYLEQDPEFYLRLAEKVVKHRVKVKVPTLQVEPETDVLGLASGKRIAAPQLKLVTLGAKDRVWDQGSIHRESKQNNQSRPIHPAKNPSSQHLTHRFRTSALNSILANDNYANQPIPPHRFATAPGRIPTGGRNQLRRRTAVTDLRLSNKDDFSRDKDLGDLTHSKP